ncbi:hypothetical protein SAMD00019534_006500 [Acytostelium subglobosum LB1]|uniref:hypothetical protein n=1 Tax=Acytostelium subglobosum LB1 TaxID=1410327 RepID=UPI000644A1B2|nr:hypothetical protein SAMD00019534_006500 [Acytostelium subglobosum LB1]GAM17475.1 hypothetical protein SAMD00019534_006500 [Acytostelium subglobosum LB1]|eukprot:XP_012759537.1 hypothetical protein SAMD00019534_006500 [Acytostelium subglobosum LB1]
MNNKSMILLSLVVMMSVAHAVAAGQPIIKASPELLAKDGDFITITWDGIAKPTAYDTIAIYYPPTADITIPIGFIPLSTASSTYKAGYGSVTIPLVNVRDTYVFRLWVEGNAHPSMPSPINSKVDITMVGASNNVTFQNINAPEKPYLAYTNYTSEMRLNWISGTDDTPVIYYGTSPSQLTMSVQGSSSTYTIDQMCASPANDPNYFRHPGYIHDAVMTGLTESTQYFYYFGSQQSGFSAVFNFTSAPKPSTEAYIVAFGDLGMQPPFSCNCEMMPPATSTIENVLTTISAPWSQSWASTLGKKSPHDTDIAPHWSLLHIGDISYARGNAFVWDWYHQSIQEITSQAPYMVSIGNHEYDYTKQPFYPEWSDYGSDSGGECGVPYYYRYNMPGYGENADNWYSYEVGPIHFTQMSGEHDFLIGSPQYNWLEADLASVNRTKTPWVIFSGHRPMYGTDSGESGMYSHLQNNLEPLIVEYDVNLCFWAHVHAYERTCGMYNFTCADNDNDAPVHITIGMAGNIDQAPWAGGSHEPQPSWSMFRAMNYGYTRFYANMTDLIFEYVGNQRNQVHDTIKLHSKYAEDFDLEAL